MRKKILLILVALVATSTAALAQGRNGLKINEVMVVNENSVVDDYGMRPAWIELYNSTHASMEISSVYLTNDKNDPTKYPVPLGDVKTNIPPLQHVLFWADSLPNRGTFHLSFNIEKGQTIYVFDADMETLIDSVTIPMDIKADQSFARTEDGAGEWKTRTGSDADNDYITPSSNNVIIDTNVKVEMFRQLDKSGIVMTVMAMAIVFGALLVLSLCFYIISKIGEKVSKTNKIKSQGVEPKYVAKAELPKGDSGEEIAAIVMALHEHLNTHDQENTVLTINKVKRAYSPWSSKIYGLRELPRK